MSTRNKYSTIGLIMLICVFTSAKGNVIKPDTTIIVNDHIGQVIEICEGQLVKFVNNSADAKDYNWRWDLGDGAISVLATDVVHYYSSNKGENYHIKLIQIDGKGVEINFDIKINSINDISTFLYDSIFCIGQKAILTVGRTAATYNLLPSTNYNIVENFRDNTVAIIDLIKTGEANLLVNASKGSCSSLIELPFLTASSKWYPFDKGEIVQKPVGANVLIYLNQADQNKDSGELEYVWGKFDKMNPFVDKDAEYKSKNYYKIQIDTNMYRYFVKVRCNSCNSCESIFFFPKY